MRNKKLNNKVMKQIFALALILFTSFSSFATESYLVNAEKNKVMVINLKETVGKEISVSIINAEGKEVFTESFNANSSLRKYNLSKLSIGTFTVIVEDAQKITFQKVYISKNNLLVDAAIEVISKPTLSKSDNKWVINGLNATYESALSIYDAKNNTVYSEKFNGEKSQRIYNVTKLQDGDYSIVYTVNNKTFTYSITK
jgi:hypothetical protein